MCECHGGQEAQGQRLAGWLCLTHGCCWPCGECAHDAVRVLSSTLTACPPAHAHARTLAGTLARTHAHTCMSLSLSHTHTRSYVKNLAEDVDDAGLKTLSEEFGEVQSAVVMRVSALRCLLHVEVARPAGAHSLRAVVRCRCAPIAAPLRSSWRAPRTCIHAPHARAMCAPASCRTTAASRAALGLSTLRTLRAPPRPWRASRARRLAARACTPAGACVCLVCVGVRAVWRHAHVLVCVHLRRPGTRRPHALAGTPRMPHRHHTTQGPEEG
jgi:hypothetical protein